MIAPKILTIEAHEKIVGNRFTLAQIIIKRTRELMEGAPVCKQIRDKFGIRGEVPNHLMPKIALEELRSGKLNWSIGSDTKPLPLISEIVDANDVVFSG
jgi:DNA-directed RNA polymerase subunit K/omega